MVALGFPVIDQNDGGDAVGWSATPAGTFHATLWHGDRAIELGALGGIDSVVLAINNAGQVVVSASDPGEHVRPADRHPARDPVELTARP
ncbi:hypothetical protein [Frankia tisae]|uniref:hypothetical protein n=1 Tax=Frankia tisae TaxID=2950104 RepID=UPI0021BF7F8C|nr:hypothetical protein [Frankia tisae]